MRHYDAEEIGRNRQAVHKDSENPRFFKDKSKEHKTGAAGEKAFAEEFDYPLDEREHKNGDGGFDFVTPMGLIDVKASRIPTLAVKTYETNRKVHVYVFAHYDPETKTAKLLGWELPPNMLKCPVEALVYGSCYVKPAHDLKSMELFRLIMNRFEEDRPELTAKLKTANWPEVIYIWEEWLNGKI